MENKNAKYLKYAIGEIVLVVLGILIALQVNNWNEYRKNHAFQKEILDQIETNLREDRTKLQSINTHQKSAIRSIDSLLILFKTQHYPDSVKYWLGNVIQFDRFQPLTNAYEVLKSKGLDAIENKELLFLLGRYYDDKAEHIIKAQGDLEYEFTTSLLPMLKKHVKSFRFQEYVELEDNDVFFNDRTYRNTFILERDNYHGSNTYIMQGIELIDAILNSMNQNK